MAFPNFAAATFGFLGPFLSGEMDIFCNIALPDLDGIPLFEESFPNRQHDCPAVFHLLFQGIADRKFDLRSDGLRNGRLIF
jgi:hypothetical protein